MASISAEVDARLHRIGASPSETLDAFETRQEGLQKKTIGFFIKRLKKRVQVSQAFEGQLEVFLKTRNSFVHEYFSVGRFSFSDEQVLKATEFAIDLRKQAKHIRKIIAGFNNLLLPDQPLLSDNPTIDEILQAAEVVQMRLK